MVSIWVGKLRLFSICDLSLVSWSDENVRDVKTSHDGKSLVDAAVRLTCRKQDLRVQWVNRQLTHDASDICKLAIIV